ncbi:hypothetical protein EVAR_68843_1 [Eumeta japonica]|uniref:Uncharacterized protein n=1 Tax=Eumeta variegata TaxID=151549 RepID=A0A4C2AES8_EUMVA|nr:hypothetical protein EVAR_68843_1 [Eumeta japonica]
MSAIRNKLEKFLADFEGLQLYEHQEMLSFFLHMLEENEECGVIEDEDRDEGHFRCCPWFYPDCDEGPDTCRCSAFYLRKAIINDMIKIIMIFLKS